MADQAYEDERIQGELPCDECGSSDGVSLYSDGHTHCFVCEHRTYENDGLTAPVTRTMSADLLTGEYKDLTKRKISSNICRKYGYMVGSHYGEPVQMANYPDRTGNFVAQKIRGKDKSFKFIGDPKAATLFGQHLFNGGRKIVVTEGEIDCLSLAEMQDGKWPVVSVKNGAAAAKKDFKSELDFLLKFDQVIIMFDMDEAGREAAVECAKILPPRRAFIATLPLNDINDCLLAGKSAEVERAIWSAKEYAPEKVVSGSEVMKRLRNRPEVTSHQYPDDIFPLLNQKTYGIRLGELDVWTSGSGMGKTTVIKQLQLHYKDSSELNQAILHLEEPLEDTAEHLIGMRMKKRISLPDVEYVEADVDRHGSELFENTDAEGNYRLALYDSFGSEEEDSLMNLIRYYAVGMGCKIIWLDHLSILVSDMGIEGDERRKIDSLMHQLKSLTQELNIYIGLIVHLRKPPSNGKSFEEGGVPSLDDLRGSGGIKQLANTVLAVSRNQQAGSDVAKNTSLVTVLKCRFTGRTGDADYVLFNDTTGCLERGSNPEDVSVDFVDEFEEF